MCGCAEAIGNASAREDADERAGADHDENRACDTGAQPIASVQVFGAKRALTGEEEIAEHRTDNQNHVRPHTQRAPDRSRDGYVCVLRRVRAMGIRADR